MALAPASQVFLNVISGLLPAQPLFGVVDYINGDAPDVVRVNWENGATQFYASTDQGVNLLAEIADDPDQEAVLTRYCNVSPSVASRGSGVVVRSFLLNPDTSNERTLLIRTDEGMYLVSPYSAATFNDSR